MPRTPNDEYYDNIEFMKITDQTFQLTLFSGIQPSFSVSVPVEQIELGSSMFKDAELDVVFDEQSTAAVFYPQFLETIKSVPNEWSVCFHLQNGILSKMFVFNSSNRSDSYNNQPSEVRLHPTGMITKVKFHDNGELHKTDGPAITIQFGGTVTKQYFFKGTEIPSEIFEQGLADEENITDEVLVTMTLLGTE